MNIAPSQIVVGVYTEKNLFDLIKRIQRLGIHLGPGKDILKTLIDWPNEDTSRRSELFPFPTNYPAKCIRIANFFELCAFVLQHPGFACQMGSIEGYDEALESLYEDTQIELTVPVFGIYGDKATLYLKSRNEKMSSAFKLGVHSEM